MKNTTDILLVGKTGTGKSATANSIVGCEAFVSKRSMTSVTKVAQFEYGEFEGRKVKVVDGPGICDTSLDNNDAVKLVIGAMTSAIAANPEGYHAILLVVSCETRFTKEDIKSVRLLKDIFGHDFIKCHAILLMTHGNIFAREDDLGTFKEWITQQEGAIQELIKECDGRVVCFDNKTKDLNIKTEQNRKLLSMIDGLAGNGVRYTSELFDKGKETRDRLLRKSKRPQLNEEDLMECGLLTQQLERIDFTKPEKLVIVLESLNKRAGVLTQIITQQGQGTSALKDAIALAKQLQETVTEQKKALNDVLRMKQQTEQIKQELELERTRSEAEEIRKQKEESRRQEEECRRQEEESRSQKEEHRRQEDGRRREAEEFRRKEDDRRRQEDAETGKMRLTQLRAEHEKPIQQKEEEEVRLREVCRKQEEERRRQEDIQKQNMRLAHLEEQLAKQRIEQEKLMKQKEEEKLKTMEIIKSDYNNVKESASWGWGDVASALAGPAVSLVKSWFSK